MVTGVMGKGVNTFYHVDASSFALGKLLIVITHFFLILVRG